MPAVKDKEKEILLNLERFGEDVDWISRRQKMLRKKFSDRYIAVVGNRVIASDVKLDALLKKLKKEGEDPSQLAIEYVSAEPPRLIL
jgi:hypothetical protein